MYDKQIMLNIYLVSVASCTRTRVYSQTSCAFNKNIKEYRHRACHGSVWQLCDSVLLLPRANIFGEILALIVMIDCTIPHSLHECIALTIVKTNDVCVVAVVSCAPYRLICILLTKTLLMTNTYYDQQPLSTPRQHIFLKVQSKFFSLSPPAELLSSCSCLRSLEIEKLLWCDMTSKWEFVLCKWQT